MKIVVAHPSLNRGGGAERVCLETVKALRERGHTVKLATLDKTDWQFLERRFGKLRRPSTESCLIRSMPIRSLFAQAVFTTSCFLPELLLLRKEKENDLIINTYGDLVDSIADLSYVNAVPARLAHVYSETSSFRWRIISQAYDLTLGVLDSLSPRNLLVANSKFISNCIKSYLDRDSIVVYPPVDVARFKEGAENSEKKNLVVTVSRLRPGKNLELIPLIAKLAQKVKFLILGLADQASQSTIRMLKKTIENQRVQDRVELLINQPSEKLSETYISAKAFLQTQPTEAFGISIVESMASGCVPVVPTNGGPWFDILDQSQGKYGYSYQTIEEAASLVSMLLANEKLRKEVSNRARLRAMDFDSAIFERKILKVVEKTYLSKFRTLNPKTTEPT